MASHNELGQKGESIAREYLINKDYEILDENWCYGKAEVDLIAFKDQQMIFAEVKTRSSKGFGQPEDFVDEAKQRHLMRAAEEYIHLMDFKGEIRFDIISVLFDSTGNFRLKHIEDTFWG